MVVNNETVVNNEMVVNDNSLTLLGLKKGLLEQ